MEIEKTAIEGVIIVKPRVFGDDRGYFFESFNEQLFNKKTGQNIQFVQDNESKSQQGVLRGLHFQVPPAAQAKLVRVVQGSILDVAVDLRKSSSTYGKHVIEELNAENKKQLFIPEGFAHGFLSLEKDTILSYKCSAYYSPDHEIGLLWNDDFLNINWGSNNPLLSEKDKNGKKFADFISPFA